MTISKLQTVFLMSFVLSMGARAFGSDARLHCDGYHALDAVVQSETSLSAVTLADTAVSHQSIEGKKYPHFNSQKVFGSPVDDDASDGKVPSGSTVVFSISGRMGTC